MKKLFLIFITLSAYFSSIGQIDRVWMDQVYRPQLQSSNHSIWLDFGYDISSNYINKDIVNRVLTGGVITRETSAYTRSWPRAKRLFFMAESQGQISYRSAIKNGWRFTLSSGFKEQAHIISTTDFFGLLINGNADYQDQTLSLGPTSASYSGRQFINLGFERNTKKMVIGGWFNLDKISRFQALQISDQSNIYTAPFGTSINGFADIDWKSTQNSKNQLAAWMGTGLGLNFFAGSNHKKNVQWLISLTRFNIDLYNDVVNIAASDSILINGVEIDDLEKINGTIKSLNMDSLSSFLTTQSTHSKLMNVYSPQLDIRLSYKVNRYISFTGSAALFDPLLSPTANISAIISLRPWIKIEPTIKMTKSRMISPALNLYVQGNDSFTFLLRTNQFTNLITPKSSKSQGAFIALQYNF